MSLFNSIAKQFKEFHGKIRIRRKIKVGKKLEYSFSSFLA